MKVTQRNIIEFLNLINEDEHFDTGFSASARLSSAHELVKTHKVTEIRSKNNDLMAYKFDILGNMTALHSDGYVRQHIGSKEINKALRGK